MRRGSRAAVCLATGALVATFAACSSFSGSDEGTSPNDSSVPTDAGSADGAGNSSLDAAGSSTFCSLLDARFCDDFERDPADAKGPWTSLVINGLGSTLVLADGGPEAGSVAAAQVVPGPNAAFLSVAFPAEMTKGDISLDILFRGMAGTSELAGFDLGDHGIYVGRRAFLEQGVHKTTLRVAFADTTKMPTLVYVGGGDSPTALSENVWYRVRIHVELTDGGLSGGLFVNGAQIVSTVESGDFGAGYSPAPPTIDIGLHSAQGQSDAGPAVVLFDNVVFTY